jgi:nitroreductase
MEALAVNADYGLLDAVPRNARELQETMPLSAVLGARRSVREFGPERPARESIEYLMLAAVRAPTALQQQAWGFVVVQDPALLRGISERARPVLLDELAVAHRKGSEKFLASAPAFNIFYDAGTLLIICGMADAPFVAADCWLAAENLMLAACSLGLGTCVIGSSISTLNLPDVKAELGIPAAYTAIAPIVLGTPRRPGSPSPRRPPVVLNWIRPTAH